MKPLRGRNPSPGLVSVGPPGDVLPSAVPPPLVDLVWVWASGGMAPSPAVTPLYSTPVHPRQVWKATGMDMSRVEFVWCADAINKNAKAYWIQVPSSLALLGCSIG